MSAGLPFSPAVRGWFEASFDEPTPAQHRGWPAISAGEHTLILAPTGSGKTLAAFLWAIDRLGTQPPPPADRRTRVLYLSPLRALAVDVERNLRAPLAGIHHAAAREGIALPHEPTVGVRTGDTTARDRRRLIAHPPDILITTPESLYLMLTSSARETLRGVTTVIVDEIHAMAATKRGAHLSLSLERLEALADEAPQRIGLSATQRPLDEIARFLGGHDAETRPRPVTIVDAGDRKPMELDVVVPLRDMGTIGQVADPPPAGPGGEPATLTGPAQISMWSAIHPRLLELIRAHRSTIVFVNGRRPAERLAARLNELAGEDLVRTHHGSISREQRLEVEDALKAGRLPAIVATSSLELGIDMGAVDLVVQVGSPGSVASGLQRVGRAGHQVGQASRGTIIPTFRGDLLEAGIVAERMLEGAIEHTRYLRNPLDVLAQQIVAMTAVEEWAVEDLYATARRAAGFAELSRDVFTAVLDLLSGRYPSDAFAELRPRVVWDRTGGLVRAREGAGRIAITNGGTIPDRGLFGVFLPDGVRVGELDEEMVYESRPGEVFVLGASSWRIQEITKDRVVVEPAPGEPGKMPFWHGDRPGRPMELGRALGAFTRELRAASPGEATRRLREDAGLDEWAARNVLAYLDEQAEATGTVPDDRTVVVERFRDEIGDWRVCILSPFGSRVHTPWGLAIEGRLAERFGPGAQVLWSDDGIVIRLPEAADRIPVEDLLFDPDRIEDEVVGALPSTTLFASVFREASARALLLPRRRPGTRTPLWQQRQRSADLLAEAGKHPTFPILLEATRECLRDVFDVPALRELMADLRSRSTTLVPVETDQASPFARSLLHRWIAVAMYEGDAPLAERRATALTLDRDLLRELLGTEELRDLLDPAAVDRTELELQRLDDRRRARGIDDLHDLLRTVGDLSEDEIAQRADGDAAEWTAVLVEAGRAIRVRVAGRERVAAAEDAARLRDALGVSLPLGLPAAFVEPAERPLEGLVARYARAHGPFTAEDVAARLGASAQRVGAALAWLQDEGTVTEGAFRPGGRGSEWCDAGVLRRLRQRSLAALRREVEPVDAAILGRFLVAWQGADRPSGSAGALAETLGQLQGTLIPASILETDVLPARVRGYRPADLDAMLAAGELVWAGRGAIGSDDGRVTLCFRDQARALLCPAGTTPAEAPHEPVHDAIRAHLAQRGASFWPDLVQAAGIADEGLLLRALWDLVWAGEVTNDTLGPLRAFVRGAGSRVRARPAARPRPGALRRTGPAAGAGRWSLVAPLLEPAVSDTEAMHARALQLLERHGVVTRESVLAESTPGGFAGVYPVLRSMEEAGTIRRGYFVAGLGAAQFALPGAVDRLRAARDAPPGEDASGDVTVLAAADPGQPFGAALPWPPAQGRPARVAGAFVVLAGGRPVAFLERGARSLLTFGTPAEDWADAVASLVKDGRLRKIELQRIDGERAADTVHADALVTAGFGEGYRGLTLRS